MSTYKCSVFFGEVTESCKLSIHVLYKTHIKVVRCTDCCSCLNGPQKLCESLSSNVKFPRCHCNLMNYNYYCNGALKSS